MSTSNSRTSDTLVTRWWYHWKDPRIQRNSAYTALVVGTLLLVINQGDYLLMGQFSLSLMLKSSLTYVVPYLVASFSAVRSQLRLKPDHVAPQTGVYRCESCLRKGDRHDVELEEGEPIPQCDWAESGSEFTLVDV